MKTPPYEKITAQLLAWYGQHKRDLPWRDAENPYAVWVSEIMLQQTQVNTVIPYFNRFMNAFPTVFSLASADRDSVMKQWEGLGYYRRAVHMRETAKKLMHSFDGNLPTTRKELITLKGIGEYTAAAVASIAFGENCAAVDGNVSRVVSRLFGVTDDIMAQSTKKIIAGYCRALLPEGNAGNFNQALMELGATACRKQTPQCCQCPVSGYCSARKSNQIGDIPFKQKKLPVPHYTVAVGVVLTNGKVLIGLRKPDALLANLWEFPGGKCRSGETPERCCVRELKEETGLTVRVVKKLCVVNHAYSHFKITLHAFLCRRVSGTPVPQSATELKYVRLSDIRRYAFPKANHPILTLLETMRA